MTSSTQLQIRRGTGSQCDAATLASSEVIHDTTNNRLRVNDGSRLGGWPLPNFSDIQKQSFGFATVGGTGNAITLTHQIPMLAWVAGLHGEFFVTNANTAAVTFAVDSISGTKNARKMKKGSISDLESGDLPVGAKVSWTYDGTQVILTVTDWGDGQGGDGELLAVLSGGGTSYDFTGLITSEFHNYHFEIENLIPVTGTAHLYARMRIAGGGSYDSGSHYYAKQEVPGSSTTAASANNNVSQWDFGNINNAAPGASGWVDLIGASQAQYVRMKSDVESGLNAPTPTVQRSYGIYNGALATPPDGIQFLFNGASISSGSIYMYGMRAAL